MKEMDAGSLEMDLGMEFYEQWDWQRFREAESMELEVEDEETGEDGVVQTGGGEEDRGKGFGKGSQEEMVGSRRMSLPQYDGAGDDLDEPDQAASISNMGADDVDAKERRMNLPQDNSTAEEAVPISRTRTEGVEAAVPTSQTRHENVEEPEEAIPMSNPRIEEAVSISKTGVEDASVNSRPDGSVSSTPSLDEALDNNIIEAQDEKLVAEDVQTYETDSGGTSESRDCKNEARGGQDMTLADDGTISEFLGSGNGDEEVPKGGEEAISRNNQSENLQPNTTITEVTTESGLHVDADASEEDHPPEEQINDKIDDTVPGGEKPVSRDNYVETPSLGKAATEIGVGSVIDKGEDWENNEPEEFNGNVSDMGAAHLETTIETEINGNIDLYSEIEGHGAESTTSEFLSNQDLKDLEGKPSSISTMDQSPVKTFAHDQAFDCASSATEKPADENVVHAANGDNMPAFMQTQGSSTTHPVLANDDSAEEDVRLPPLLRMEAPVQTRRLEIPDSDAITESSQQSPQKPIHAERTLHSARGNTENEELSFVNNATKEDNDRETEDIESSFERECATSSIDPKKNINEPETMEAESLQIETDDRKETGEPIEVALVGSAEKVKENSKAGKEDDTDAESHSTQTLSRKKTNKRGRPPGRKRSGIVDSLDDEGSTEQKAKLVKADSDKPPSMEAKDNTNASSHVNEKKGRGRPPGRKVSTLTFDNPPVEQKRAAVSTPESYQVIPVDTIVEPIKHSPSKETPEIESSPNKSTSEKRKRGRPAGRKISTLLTVTNDGGDMEGIEREVAPMEEDTQSNIGTKLTDEPVASSPVQFTQEKRGRGRPPSRKSSVLTPRKQDADEAGENLDELNDTTIAAPSDNINGSDEPVINDTMDESTTNSSSPVKRKRGRPFSRKPSRLSPQKEDTEEIIKEDSNNVSVVGLEDFGMNEATPSHKSNEDHVTNSSSSVKRKRGRPAGRKSSGIEPEQIEVEEPPSKTPTLSNNDVGMQEPTINGKLNDDSDDDSPVRSKKRGRSSRKASKLSPEQSSVNEATDENSQDIAMEESPDIIARKSMADVRSADEIAEIGSSPVKRGRGRPVSRKVSRVGLEKPIVTKALEVTPDVATETAAAADIDGPVDDIQSFDEPPPLSSPPRRGKRGRPGSRKVSKLDPQETEANESTEKHLEDIVMQEAAATINNEPPAVNSSPEKRKRGRPFNRTLSGRSPANKDSFVTVEATSKNAAITASENSEPEPEPDIGLFATSSPEKRKRGRPSRKTSTLNNGSITPSRMSSELGSAGKKFSTEIVDSDDELQNESPPAKEVKPEPKKRGRPSAVQPLDVSAEDSKANEEDLIDEVSTMAKDSEKIQTVIQTREPPASDKRRRGRPSATKARRISNSDSDVTEEEQQPSREAELPGAEVKELVEQEDDEDEAPVVEKKKRGRPTLLKNKGKQTTKVSEPVDEAATQNIESTAGSSKSKVSGSQVSTSSNTSSSSQRQDAFLAEMKAMKLVSLIFPFHPLPSSS